MYGKKQSVGRLYVVVYTTSVDGCTDRQSGPTARSTHDETDAATGRRRRTLRLWTVCGEVPSASRLVDPPQPGRGKLRRGSSDLRPRTALHTHRV